MTKKSKVGKSTSKQTDPVVDDDGWDEPKQTPVSVISIKATASFYYIENLGSQMVKVLADRRHEFEHLPPGDGTHVKPIFYSAIC